MAITPTGQNLINQFLDNWNKGMGDLLDFDNRGYLADQSIHQKDTGLRLDSAHPTAVFVTELDALLGKLNDEEFAKLTDEHLGAKVAATYLYNKYPGVFGEFDTTARKVVGLLSTVRYVDGVDAKITRAELDRAGGIDGLRNIVRKNMLDSPHDIRLLMHAGLWVDSSTRLRVSAMLQKVLAEAEAAPKKLIDPGPSKTGSIPSAPVKPTGASLRRHH